MARVRLLVAFLCLLSVPPAPGAELALVKDIVYTKVDGVELKLDFVQPASGEGPFPLVVCIHGGAWQIGTRSMHHGTMRLLAERGYAAASVQYRFAPKAQFPAQIEDVKTAVRFFRANAAKYKIDAGRVGALGDSAGGHLALLVGLMDLADGLEGKEYRDQSSKVQAVVNYYGPTYAVTWKATPLGDGLLKGATGKDGDGLLKDFLGTSDRKAEVMFKASPTTYVDSKDPPILTFHGTVDPLVQLEQAERLHKLLKEKGVVEHLEVIQGGSHGWGGKTKEKTDRMTVEFFDKHLKKAK